jgi:hypothetical protein
MSFRWPATRRSTNAAPAKGLRQFLSSEEQQLWLNGEATFADSDVRAQSLEQRFKYADRFDKLLRRPQAPDVLDILQLYAATCIPIPRRTERSYWSVSCLPSTNDKPLTRVNASWMELFTLLPDGDALRARVILHLADFTSDGSLEPDQLDEDRLLCCVERPEDMTHSIWRDGKAILIAKVRGATSIRSFIGHAHARRAIRNFNLTHMNRGRNAYQASHCYSLADAMVGD